MKMKTADLFDEYEKDVNVCPEQFLLFGLKPECCGQIETVKCFEDNSLVKAALAEKGKGKVLVVDGGKSFKRALMGDLIAASAIKNGWEGVIISGVIRDSEAINQMNLHVKALGTNPRKSLKQNQGLRNSVLELEGTLIHPGHWIYSDRDGILVSPVQLH